MTTVNSGLKGLRLVFAGILHTMGNFQVQIMKNIYNQGKINISNIELTKHHQKRFYQFIDSFINLKHAHLRQNIKSIFGRGNTRQNKRSCVPWSPGYPSLPGNPSRPSRPGRPSSPGNPGNPGCPSLPGCPGKPSNPGSPRSPFCPGSPEIYQMVIISGLADG